MKKRIISLFLALLFVAGVFVPNEVKASTESKIKKKLTITYEEYEYGVIAKVKNKNKFAVKLKAEMYYYKGKKLLDTVEDTNSSIPAGKTVILNFSKPYDTKSFEPLEYTKYKMKYEVEKNTSWYKDHSKDLKYTTEKMENGEIHCEIKNKGKSTLYYTEYCILFYDGDELVDYSYSNKLAFEKGDTVTANLSTTKNYTKFKFYINCAYTLN